MSRPIKFRLSYMGKVVGYEKWYPGHQRQVDERDLYWEAYPCWLYSSDGEKFTPHVKMHDAKDQFTGLLDKDGREIYEGDVVKHRRPGEKDFFTREVGIEPSRGVMVGLWPIGLDAEIVGNIHENKELLK